MTLCFKAAASEDGWMLRDVLRAKHVSASLLTALKQSDGIRIDGVPMRANERVRAGAEILLTLPPEERTEVVPQDLPLAIAHESRHAVVLDKPAGMTVHPTLGYSDGTLANAWLGELARRGETGVFRPVNRIDRNTSGLVLCAKNVWAAPLLARSVQKRYAAVVEGELPLGRGVIDAPIARCEDSIIRRCVRPDGKQSRTEYEVIGAGGGHSLVFCLPVTGRTHQIRVHFASIGHPLAGDDLYGGHTKLIARHALHCAEILFCEPETGQMICVHSVPSGDMAELARVCKLNFSIFSHSKNDELSEK